MEDTTHKLPVHEDYVGRKHVNYDDIARYKKAIAQAGSLPSSVVVETTPPTISVPIPEEIHDRLADRPSYDPTPSKRALTRAILYNLSKD